MSSILATKTNKKSIFALSRVYFSNAFYFPNLGASHIKHIETKEWCLWNFCKYANICDLTYICIVVVHLFES